MEDIQERTVEVLMTEEQKHFLKTTLPEAILAEQGRSFGMEFWANRDAPGSSRTIDGVTRIVPNCGTVCCIGGMADALFRKADAARGSLSEDTVASLMGLTIGEGEALFYQWLPLDEQERSEEDLGWPESFAIRFQAADTPLGKAQVAAELCVLVGETEGRCLYPIAA